LYSDSLVPGDEVQKEPFYTYRTRLDYTSLLSKECEASAACRYHGPECCCEERESYKGCDAERVSASGYISALSSISQVISRAMVAFKLFLAVTASQLVAAWPEPTAAAYLDNCAIDCSKLTGCLGVLKKIGPAANTFCSSYLKIPQAKTLTTTTTPTAV
jgi:hypothetical protein